VKRLQEQVKQHVAMDDSVTHFQEGE